MKPLFDAQKTLEKPFQERTLASRRHEFDGAHILYWLLSFAGVFVFMSLSYCLFVLQYEDLLPRVLPISTPEGLIELTICTN